MRSSLRHSEEYNNMAVADNSLAPSLKTKTGCEQLKSTNQLIVSGFGN